MSNVSPQVHVVSATVSFRELLDTFDWVSCTGPFENRAFISRCSGKIYWEGSDLNDSDDELPEDVEDESLYVAVPHKTNLHLGRILALRFVQERLPESHERVKHIFSRRGAYAQFKALLDGVGHLELWYEYEAKATEQALREWAAENEVPLEL